MYREGLVIMATVALFVVGCAHPAVPREPASVATNAKPAAATVRASPSVNVSDDIARLCRVDIGNAERAPKFDFDRAELLPDDRNVLQQVATCVTTGPLKGRGLRLIGRADQRGEVEYNMTLGEHRAGSAFTYLTQLGVDAKKIAETSRGKLDATGTNEDGWRRDRRVDILLQ